MRRKQEARPSRRGNARRDAAQPAFGIRIAYPIAVAIATFIVFLPALSASFVNFDDDRIVLHNPYLRLPLADAWSWMWSTLFIGHYQPLTWASLFADARIGGFAPLPFHVTSLALHALAAAVLTIVLARLLHLAPATRDAGGATVWLAASAAALLWSVHPLRVESVAWIAERRDPLSILFWLLALHAYLRWADPGARPGRPAWYAWSIAALALSLLAKAWGMSFVVVLIAIDWAILDRRAWIEKVPYAALGAAAAAVAWLAQRNAVETMVPIERWGWTARTLQACYGLCFYVWKTIVPANLAALYELPRDWREMAVPFLLSAAIVAAAVAALVVWRRHRPVAAAAIVYAVTLAPVLGFAQSGPQLAADRYAYVSGLAIVALAGGGIVLTSRRIGLRPAIAASAAVIIAFGVGAWRQAAVWHDSTTLWRHALDSGHPSFAAHLNYGQALRAAGDIDAAIGQYQLAVERRPDGGNAWYNLGNALKAKGRLAEAERAYQQAIVWSPWKVDAQVNLGNLYFTSRRLDEAIAQYRAAAATLAAVPPAEFSPEPFLYLGMALGDRGDRAGAEQALAVAVRYPATRARAQQELARLNR